MCICEYKSILHGMRLSVCDMKLQSFTHYTNIHKHSLTHSLTHYTLTHYTFTHSRTIHSLTHICVDRDHHNGSTPTLQDYEKLEKLASKVFHENQVDMHSILSTKDLKSLCRLNNTILITTASILGSFLSQEVIKGISRCGIPGYNVFVYSNDDFICKAVPIGTV